MIQLRMAATKPTFWIFGDETAFELRDALRAPTYPVTDLQVYGYTAATFDSVIDAQLLAALGSGTVPNVMIVCAGAYDALFIAMGGGDTQTALAELLRRFDRLHNVLRIKGLDNIPVRIMPSICIETHCDKLGIPPTWASFVVGGVGEARDVTLDMVTLPTALWTIVGTGKESGHEPS